MTTPPVQLHGEAVTVLFDEAFATFTADRWRESRGDVTAEVLVTSTTPGPPGHIHQARLNLISTQSRRTFARQCLSRWKGPDWEDLVERFCLLALEVRRRGQPVEDLGGPVEVDVDRIEGLMPDDGVTLFYGDGGVGKSTLLLYAGCCIRMGIPFLGKRTVEGQPLYVDFETNKRVQNRRLARLERGMAWTTPPHIRYFRAEVPLVEMGPDLRRIADEERADVILLDSLGYAGGSSVDADITLPAFRVLQALRRPVLAVAHVSKADDERPFGSVFSWNSARSAVMVAKQQQPAEAEVVVGLFHRKANDGPLQRPIGVSMTFLPEATVVRPTDLRQVPGLAERLPIRERLRGMLVEGARSAQDLAEALSVNGETVERILRRMRVQGVVIRQPDGSWGLTL